MNANGIVYRILWLPLKDILVLKLLKNAFVASKIRMSLFLHEYDKLFKNLISIICVLKLCLLADKMYKNVSYYAEGVCE